MVDKDLMEQKKKEYIERLDRIHAELLKSLEKDIDGKIYDYNNWGYNYCVETIDRSLFYQLLEYSKGKYDYQEEETCWKDFFSEFLMPYVNNGFVVNVHRQYGEFLANEHSSYLIRFSWDSINQNSEGKLTFTESSCSEESSYAETKNESKFKRFLKKLTKIL